MRKPATNKSLEHQLDIAEDERHDLVHKCDMDEFKMDNAVQHKVLNKKLDGLMPLKELVPTLEDMVKNQEALQRGSRWIVWILGFIATVLGITFTLYKMITGRW